MSVQMVYEIATHRPAPIESRSSAAFATADGGRQRTSTDGQSQARHAVTLVVAVGTRLRDEEAGSSNLPARPTDPRVTEHLVTRDLRFSFPLRHFGSQSGERLAGGRQLVE